MAQIIAFCNQKGGVGKTTLSVQTAFYLALQKNKKVLLIDMDAQGNSTRTLINKNPLQSCLSDDLLEDELSDIPVHHTEWGIDVIGSSQTGDEGYETESLPIEKALNPAKHIACLRDKYDYIIMDSPPSMGRRLISVLIATDFVVCPTKLSGYAVEGIVRLFESIYNIKEAFNPRLEILGAIVNEYDGSAESARTLAELQEELPDFVFETTLRHRPPFDTATIGLPVWKVRNGHRAGQELAQAAEEILARIKKVQ